MVDETQVRCRRCASAEVRHGSVEISFVNPVDSWISKNHLLFVRPALTKLPAVAIFNSIIDDVASHAPSWGTTYMNVASKERVSHERFYEMMRYAKLNDHTDLIGRRFAIVTYEPRDSLPLFLRAAFPMSALVVLCRQSFLRRKEAYARNADLILTDAVSDDGIDNSIVIDDFSRAGPTIHHWLQSWAFDNNKEWVRLFGDDSCDDRAAEWVANPDSKGSNMLLVMKHGQEQTPLQSTCGQLRSAFAKRVTTAYVQLSLTHKFTGVLAKTGLSDQAKLEELLKRGARPHVLPSETR